MQIWRFRAALPKSQLKQVCLCETYVETVQRHNLLFSVPGAEPLNLNQTWSQLKHRVRKSSNTEGGRLVLCKVQGAIPN